MSSRQNNRSHRSELEQFNSDPSLGEALQHFRSSVQAWGDATYHRQRSTAVVVQRVAWRRSVAWGLSLVLSVSVLGTAVWQRHFNEIARQHELKREQEQRRVAASRQPAAQQTAVQQPVPTSHARQSEDLLANVDRDISRQVPAAMEPLAQLMTDEDIQ